MRKNIYKNLIVTENLKNMGVTLTNIASTTSQFLKPSAIKLFTFFYLTSQGANAQATNSTSDSGLDSKTFMIVSISSFLGAAACLCCCFSCIDRMLPVEEEKEQEQPLLINGPQPEIRGLVI